MNRDTMIKTIQEQGDYPWDVLIIGGGATGLGTAVESASRGFKTIYWNNMILQKVRPAVAPNSFMVAFDTCSRAMWVSYSKHFVNGDYFDKMRRISFIISPS